MNYQYPTDFIERTLELLKQYESFVPHNKEHYEITLLLNSCVGLLFVLCERQFQSKLPKSVAGLQDIEKNITTCRGYSNSQPVEEQKTVATICKHLRNSVAHCRFKSKNGTTDIETIIFDDYLNGNQSKPTFHAEIEVQVLRKFLIDLAEKTLFNIKSTQPTK